MSTGADVWRVKKRSTDSLLPLARQVGQWQKQQTAQSDWSELPINKVGTRGCGWAAIRLGLEAQGNVKN